MPVLVYIHGGGMPSMPFLIPGLPYVSLDSLLLRQPRSLSLRALDRTKPERRHRQRVLPPRLHRIPRCAGTRQRPVTGGPECGVP